MKIKLRKIVVENKLFFWKFSSQWREGAFYSTLTVITERYSHQFFIQFKTNDTFTAGSPLNEGLPMERKEQLYFINLNQPRHVAEIIQYIINNLINSCIKKNVVFNGNIILSHLGYTDIENYLIND